MDALRGQVQAVVDELNAVKSEIIQIKTAHANMHQASVESNTTSAARYAEQVARVTDLEKKMDKVADEVGRPGGSSKRSLIEPKQVEVEKFTGSIADSRSKFLEWGESERPCTVVR